MPMVRVSAIWRLYRARLQNAWLQELLAAAGIATGAALVFAVVAANTSLTSNARGIVRAVAGDAQLQVVSRGPEGFDGARVGAQVRALRDVEVAAPVLEQRAVVRTRSRAVDVTVVGVDATLAGLGAVASKPALLGLRLLPGILVTSAVADSTGLPSDRDSAGQVRLDLRGRAMSVPVSGVFKASEGGALATGPFVVAPLERVQALSGLPGRITRLLVRVRPGSESRVLEQLRRLDGGRFDAGHATDELKVLATATAPNDQATLLFAAISVVVGLMLAGTAMLLTVPLRRREIAQLRLNGYSERQAALIVLSQAMLLGIVAASVGTVAGAMLARTDALKPPDFLGYGFAVGTATRLPWWIFATTIIGGTLATCLAASQPLLDLRRGQPINRIYQQSGEPGQSLPSAVRRSMARAAIVLLIVGAVVTQLWPTTSLVGVGTAVFAMLLAVPTIFAAVLKLADLVTRIDRPSVLPVAIGSLRAASLRSIALVATCAVAIGGTLAVNGARSDLLDGLAHTLGSHVSTADVWVATRSLDLARQPFRSPAAELERVPGVASVRELYGGLHDVAGNRVWVIGKPAGDPVIVPPSEVEDGDANLAAARIKRGGWIALSSLIADNLGARVGGTVALPTPTGIQRFRVAATTGNLGWGSGAIVMNAADYRRAWATNAPSAIEIDAARGVSSAQLRDRIAKALGPTSGVEAQTSAQRLDDALGVAHNGLARLHQISLLLLIASAMALAIALIAVLREQLPMIALGVVNGQTRAMIWRTLMTETILILLAGCLAGLAAGVYGHYLAVRWLHVATGSSAPWSWSLGQAALTCATLSLIAMATTAVAGYRNSNAPPRLALSRT